MSGHVLLNLFKKLRKRDKMRGLPSILSLFHNEINELGNTGAGILDSVYHMTLKLAYFKITFFWRETSSFCHLLCNIIMDIITPGY